MRQRTTQLAPPAIFHVAGTQYILADVASRPVNLVASHFHLLESRPDLMCPQTFLTVFNRLYPLPQPVSWINVQPPSNLFLSVISTLRGQQLGLQQWTRRVESSHGKTGLPMQPPATGTPGSASRTNQQGSNAFLPLPPGFVLGSLGTDGELASSLLKKPSVTWHKPSFWLGTKIPDDHTEQRS